MPHSKKGEQKRFKSVLQKMKHYIRMISKCLKNNFLTGLITPPSKAEL